MSSIARLVLIATLVLLTSFVTVDTAAADQDRGWNLRLTAAALRPTVGGDFEDTVGVALGVGYRWTRRVGVELEIGATDVDMREEDLFFPASPVFMQTDLDVRPVLARLHVHLTPGRRFDLYAGPTLGWLDTGDLEITFSGPAVDPFPGSPFVIPTDGGFAWGGHIGIDVPFGGRARGAFFTGRVTYLASEIEASIDDLDADFDLDPVMVQIGIGYRF